MTYPFRQTARFWTAALLLCLSSAPALAQLPGQLSDRAEISLITMYPGDQIWSIFGHSAFRVYDPVSGTDELFNYGTFSFRDPVSFVLKFTYGQLDYMLTTSSFENAVYEYAYFERSMIEQ